jgi:hypothetical protein
VGGSGSEIEGSRWWIEDIANITAMVSKLSEEGRWLIAIENITAMVSISLWSTRAGNKLIVGRIINRSKLFILFLFSGLILDPDARRAPGLPGSQAWDGHHG